jgi:phosphoserine aminotransferase
LVKERFTKNIFVLYWDYEIGILQGGASTQWGSRESHLTLKVKNDMAGGLGA